LTKIIALQLFFSILFGSLAFVLFFTIGRKFAGIISVIFALNEFASHDLAASILATTFTIFTIYLSVYTTGQHYGINKKFSTVFIGTIATIVIGLLFLVLLGPQFIVTILFISLLIALFGFHNQSIVHASLQKEKAKPVKKTKEQKTNTNIITHSKRSKKKSTKKITKKPSKKKSSKKKSTKK